MLKINDSLHFAVLTGCLRISRESIFTGLNNLKVLSLTDVRFDEYFGFTDEEVRGLLSSYGLLEAYETMKKWYDGYHFGRASVYCPWDVLNYCDDLRVNPTARPRNYWSNTSSNDVVRRLIEQSATGVTKREIEKLIAGESIEKELRQELTYPELYTSIDNLWSVLFTTGYLTQNGNPEGEIFRLCIPNLEIRNIFTRQVMDWFKDTVRQDGEALQRFCEALKNGDAAGVERQLGAYLKKTISIRDTFVRKQSKENFYHGILLGILGFKETWGVYSNRESGGGYSDILVEIDEEELGIVIEIKYPDNGDLAAGCSAALAQIEKNRYGEQLRDVGMRTILKYGVACYQKRCRVELQKEE